VPIIAYMDAALRVLAWAGVVAVAAVAAAAAFSFVFGS
jgi:hypothetical protein